MEENQTNQNLNQQPVQPVQPQPEQVQQPVQGQPVQGQVQAAEQPSVSMQIQQLLVQQQQYQKQYNELVDYVKKTPNLPIEQVNQIKQQLDQLNALFVEGKQKLQALGYNQVQVQKPTEIKKGSITNFSLKKVAIGCGIVLLLIFAGFFITLSSLIKNPNALSGIGVSAATAKVLLQAFTGLIFGSVILVMLGVIISNIYRLITVKNQGKGKFIRGLIGGFVGAGAMGALMGIVFIWIGKIVTVVQQVDYDIIQPYLVGRVEEEGIDEFAHPYKNGGVESSGIEYPLIAPSEIAYSIRWYELTKLTDKELPGGYNILDVKLLCGNKEGTVLEQNSYDDGQSNRRFNGTCLYSEKGTYTYGIEITYDNTTSKERKTVKYNLKSLNFESDVTIYKDGKRLLSKNGEFILGEAPAKITVDTTQVFRTYKTQNYNVEWDLDGDFTGDIINQVKFDHSYKIPQVYYVTYKFPEVYDDLWYRFPVRVEQSDKPVCGVNVEQFKESPTKFRITTEFVDESSAATISKYNYSIQDLTTRKIVDTLNDQDKSIVYTFPEKGNYAVILKYVTLDGKQGQCESDSIQLAKESFDVQYAILSEDPVTGKFKELCSSNGSEYSKCSQINLSTVPQKYQLQIKSITPKTINTSKAVYFEDALEDENKNSLMEDNDTYDFTVREEGTYELRIVTSDLTAGMDEEEKVIKFIAKKSDIVGILSITTAESNPEDRIPVSEGFEPLTVILDASKTEINIPGDEIIYFTWDFGDGEVKTNQQNGIVVHTYNYDYDRENGIFTPKVTIKTLGGLTEVISGPKLNVKKGLISVKLSSISHPTGQAPVDKDVTFIAEFDGLPERMIWDFGDGTMPYSCKRRDCTEVVHTYTEEGLYSVKLSLEFDAVQQMDTTMQFKVYKG